MANFFFILLSFNYLTLSHIFCLRKLHLIPHFCPAMLQPHFFKESFLMSYLQITHLLTGIWVSTEISKFLVTRFNREFSVLLLTSHSAFDTFDHFFLSLASGTQWFSDSSPSSWLGLLCRPLPSVLCLRVGSPHYFILRSPCLLP